MRVSPMSSSSSSASAVPRALLIVVLLWVGTISPIMSGVSASAPPVSVLMESDSTDTEATAAMGVASASMRNNPILATLRSYEVARPQWIGNEAITATESLSVNEHPETLAIRLSAFGKNFDVSLKKNHELVSEDYQQIRLSYDSERIEAHRPASVDVVPVVQCYYHGTVDGDAHSFVSMSTCNGLRGSVQGLGEHFGVEPASVTPTVAMPTQARKSSGFSTSAFEGNAPRGMHPLSQVPHTDHIIFRHSDVSEEEKQCSVVDDHLHADEGASPTSSTAPIEEDPSSTSGVSPTGTPATPTPSSGGETIELLVFNDNARWKNKGESTEADTLAVVNSVKQFYSSTMFNRPVRVVLVGQVTFTQGDPYQADMTDSGVAVEGERGLLQAFHRYRNAALNILPKHDSGQLFSERRFTSNIMGLAGVGAMCSEFSGSICCMTSPQLVKNAMIAAHETGHTLTMMHDGVYNTCPSGGFIMATTTGVATTFSTCSVASGNEFIRSTTANCLLNYAARQSAIQQRADTLWLPGAWSECSVTCGSGFQVRPVECRDSTGAVRPILDCNEFTRPKTVQPCNATVECDACSMVNCSSIGTCANGVCVCPEGFSGTRCELSPSMIKKESEAKALAQQTKDTSQMALVMTAVLTGVALALASLIWMCRAIRRHRANEQFDKVKMLTPPLPPSCSSQALSGSPTDFAAINGSASSDALAQSASASPLTSSSAGTCTAGAPACGGTPCGLHKTPRSIPRTIAVKP